LFVYLAPYLRRCTAEENTVHREGAKLSFFKGDGVVKNVPEDKAAVFEVYKQSCFSSFVQLLIRAFVVDSA
jgi:hypothetical protein